MIRDKSAAKQITSQNISIELSRAFTSRHISSILVRLLIRRMDGDTAAAARSCGVTVSLLLLLLLILAISVMTGQLLLPPLPCSLPVNAIATEWEPPPYRMIRSNSKLVC
ncbi:hypothetical protein J6590_004794 [Homalodisca vitripennis]|nr:hypothetical protein J6590_004794 [Homalodisca vitripennis]